MTTTDIQGNIHDRDGKFAGHIPTAAAVKLPAPAVSDDEFAQLNDALRGAQSILDSARTAQAIAVKQVIVATARRNFPNAERVTFVEWYDSTDGQLQLFAIEDADGNSIVDGETDYGQDAWALLALARRIDNQDLVTVFDEGDHPDGNTYSLDLTGDLGKRWSPGESLNLTTISAAELSRLHSDVSYEAGQIASFASISDLDYRLYEDPAWYGIKAESVAKAEQAAGGKDELLRAITGTAAWNTLEENANEQINDQYTEGITKALDEIIDGAL
ncbi:hypothetical protein [Agromyces humi]|uniref:hypothetical protein n=1 Tax=Agromyces humi TaxID=1766800 RepID=UPI00135853A6|nr:hypothetical protein [Agromyces humi]